MEATKRGRVYSSYRYDLGLFRVPSSISVSIRYSVLLILPITCKTNSRSKTNFPTFGKSSAKVSRYLEEQGTSEFVRKDTTTIVDLCYVSLEIKYYTRYRSFFRLNIVGVFYRST